MLIEKIAIEALALIVVLVLIIALVIAVRKVQRQIKAVLPPPKQDDLVHFDELLQEHEKLHVKPKPNPQQDE